jgi:hypothetical protein
MPSPNISPPPSYTNLAGETPIPEKSTPKTTTTAPTSKSAKTTTYKEKKIRRKNRSSSVEVNDSPSSTSVAATEGETDVSESSYNGKGRSKSSLHRRSLARSSGVQSATMGGSMGPPPPPPGWWPSPIGPQDFRGFVQNANSTSIQDITPKKFMDETACLKLLTTYQVHTMQKVPSHSIPFEPTWERAEIIKEAISQEDILVALGRLKDSRRTVQEKKAYLNQAQQNQISCLLDNLTNTERDLAYEWSLTQLDHTAKTSWLGQREVITITVYVKRAPRRDEDPVKMVRTMEIKKQAALERAERQVQSGISPPGPPPPPPAVPYSGVHITQDSTKGKTKKKATISDMKGARNSEDSESFKSFSESED